MTKFYNLSNDYLYKLVFSNEENLKYLLLEFFNIDLKDKKIEYLNTELLKTNKLNKVGIVDMLIGIKSDNEIEEIILLELQNLNRHNFKERLEYYMSKIKANYSLKNGEDYVQMRKVTGLAIINYDLGYIDLFNNVNLTILDNNEYKIFNEKVGYKIFNLSKIKNNENDLGLVKLFKGSDIKKLEREITNKNCRKILETMKKYNKEEREMRKMEEIIELMKNETEHYDTAFIAGEKKGYDSGKQEGYNSGYDSGKNFGINQGIEQNKKDVARNMLNKNIDIQTISEVTKLPIEKIKTFV